jgi:hypothetical protein
LRPARTVALLLTLALFLAGLARTAAAQAAGVVDGQVRNATAGAPPPAGLPVMLHIVGEGDQVQRRQTVTDQDGLFSFGELDPAAGLKYLPTVEYQGALYFDQVLTLVDEPHQTASITIYEGTTSDQLIAFERTNLLVQNIAPNRLDLMEMGSIANIGDRTYLGQDPGPARSRATLDFAVPPGAVDVALQAGFRAEDLITTPTGFSLSSPVVPGRHQVAYSYSLPYGADRLVISKRLTYPAASFTLYVPDVGLRVSSAQLESRGPTELGGQKFLLFGAQNLPRGTELRVELTNLPSTAGSVAEQLGPPVLAAGSLLLLVGLGMVYLRRRAAQNLADGSLAPARAERERMQSLLTLASLDERFEQGELPEAEYRREREAEKQRLLALSAPGGGAGTVGE